MSQAKEKKYLDKITKLKQENKNLIGLLKDTEQIFYNKL